MENTLLISTTEAGKEGMLSFVGDANMGDVESIKETILEAIGDVDRLHLNLDKVESVDVSFIQLLCATHRECFHAGKEIFIQSGERNGNLQKLLTEAGYLKQCGCVPDSRAGCLWRTYHDIS